MRVSQRIHIFTNIEGVLVPQGSGAVPRFLLRAGVLDWSWSKPLVSLAAEFDVALVIRSSWTLTLSQSEIISCLPRTLGRRVVGATDEIAEVGKSGVVRTASRYQVITRYTAKHHVLKWIALDDSADGWPEECLSRLVLCRGEKGLSDSDTVTRAREALIALWQAPDLDGVQL